MGESEYCYVVDGEEGEDLPHHPLSCTGQATQYPSEWFNLHKKKPPCGVNKIYKDVESFSALYHTVSDKVMGATPTAIDVTTVIAFLHACIYHKKGETEEKWESFGLVIGRAKGKVALNDILDINETSEELTLSDVTNRQPPSISDVMRLMLMITGFYRFAESDQTVQYQDAIGRKISQLMAMERKGTLIAMKSIYGGWLQTKPFLITMAALDMFFGKFPRHEYHKARFGTIITKFKDCGVLASLTAICSILGYKRTDPFAPWIWVGRVCEDYKRVSMAGQEVGKDHSYLMYYTVMGLADRTPYSATANPNLHFFLHCIGCGINQTRSLNARMVGNPEYGSIMINAAIVVRVFGTYARLGLYIKPKEMQLIKDQEAELVLTAGDAPTSASADDWCRYMYANGFFVHPALRMKACIVWGQLKDTREGTIGRYLTEIYTIEYKKDLQREIHMANQREREFD